jgi:hypothetical protein
MSANDIFTLVALVMSGALLLWVNIKMRKNNLKEDLK